MQLYKAVGDAAGEREGESRREKEREGEIRRDKEGDGDKDCRDIQERDE